MELDFDNDEFESFLKQKADQYKMYPSEKSWKGISFVLHSRSRLITIGGSLLLISVFFFFGGRFLNNRSVAIDKTPARAQKIITSFSSPSASTLLPVSPENARRSVAVATDIALKNEVIEPSAKKEAILVKMPVRQIYQSGPTEKDLISFSEIAANPVLDKDIAIVPAHPELYDVANLNAGEISHSAVTNTPPARIEEEGVSEKAVNWLQEIAAIKLTTPKRNPFNLQFYFSPTVSYRKLVDNSIGKGGSFMTSNIGSSPDIPVDRYVEHKPAIGVEVGSNLLFKASKSLTLKSGIQMNYSRYTIQAFRSYVERASIALNSVGYRSSDTMTSYTTLRNFNGHAPEQLENQYLQVSVPLGAELVVIGKKRLQFSIAGTVQPTYLIMNDAYLLTTDYEHYTKEPTLVRKWNVHTSAEAFISYKSGSVRWQVGPQFRYQLLSSYADRYPIKEYLMEYGVKFGISKTLK